MSKKSSEDSGQNLIPQLAGLKLGEEQKQKEEQSKIFNDDSEDSAEELEVRVEAGGGIKKYRNKPAGVESEDYDIHAQCELFLEAGFVPKKGSSAKKKSTKVDDEVDAKIVEDEKQKSAKGSSKGNKKEKEPAEPPVPSAPVLLQYSFVAHTLGLQTLRSPEVNQSYKPLKQSRFTDTIKSRATLPRQYTFRSKSAPEFLANQRLWSRSLTRENRNMLDNPEYREGLKEINKSSPDSAMEIVSRFWEFTDEKRPELAAKALESTKFMPRIFNFGDREFLGEEHYVQEAGSTPKGTQDIARIVRVELNKKQEEEIYKKLIKDAGYTDVDADLLIRLRDLQREAELRGRKINESGVPNQLELLDDSIGVYTKQRESTISEFLSKGVSKTLQNNLGNFEDFLKNAFDSKVSQLRKSSIKTSEQAVRLLAAEPRRNPASFILHQMALDLIDSGKPNYTEESVFSMIPMTMSDKEAVRKGVAADNGASRTVTVARSVNKRLNNFMPYRFYYPGGDGASDHLQEQFMLREGELVRHWVGYQKERLEQELERTNEAILEPKNEEESKFLTDKKVYCEKYLALCRRLIPGPTEEPMVKMNKQDMSQLVELVDLNSKAKWYPRSKPEQNLGNSL